MAKYLVSYSKYLLAFWAKSSSGQKAKSGTTWAFGHKAKLVTVQASGHKAKLIPSCRTSSLPLSYRLCLYYMKRTKEDPENHCSFDMDSSTKYSHCQAQKCLCLLISLSVTVRFPY